MTPDEERRTAEARIGAYGSFSKLCDVIREVLEKLPLDAQLELCLKGSGSEKEENPLAKTTPPRAPLGSPRLSEYSGSDSIDLKSPVDKSVDESEIPAARKENLKLARDRRKYLGSLWSKQAHELWGVQEQLRKTVLPRSRKLAATEPNLLRVCAVLEHGHTVADCKAVLHRLAEEVARDRRQGRWFNGVTHWRIANFERALARVGTPLEGPMRAGEVARQRAEQILDARAEAAQRGNGGQP